MADIFLTHAKDVFLLYKIASEANIGMQPTPPADAATGFIKSPDAAKGSKSAKFA